MRLFGLSDFVKGDDVWMIQRRNRTCFLFKSKQSFFIFDQVGRHNFQCYLAFKPCIFSKVNFAHPADTYRVADFVMPYVCAGRESHLARRGEGEKGRKGEKQNLSQPFYSVLLVCPLLFLPAYSFLCL